MGDKVNTSADGELSFNIEDEYQRKPIAQKVIDLLTSDVDVSPLVIDGGWGAGKTRFCKKLITLFKETKPDYQCVYVDAFKADHADQPLMTLLAAVIELVPEKERAPLIAKAIPAARFFGKIALKAASGWLLKQQGEAVAEEWREAVKDAGDQAIDHVVGSLLKDHVEAERNIEMLRQALAGMASKNPIVIFVDELDRCRPDFSVDMLESIKHIFDVEGVQFVLITNTDQLRSSVAHCYGVRDAHRYLDKFIGFNFDLPVNVPGNRAKETLAACAHFQRFILQSEVLKTSVFSKSVDVMEFAHSMIAVNGRSLREVETWIKYLEVYQVVTEGKGLPQNLKPSFGMLRIFAVYLYCFCSQLQRDIQRGNVDADPLFSVLGKTRVRKAESEGGYGDDLDTIASIVALEATRKTEALEIVGGEEIQRWRKRIASFFQDPFARSDMRYMEQVRDVFRALELGGGQ